MSTDRSTVLQIIEGIYQLLTPFPQFTIEAAKEIRGTIQEHPRVIKGLPYVLPYMIRDGGDTVLVDCGWNTDSAYQSLEEGMKEHHAHPTEVQKLVVTHVHPDHYGMAGRLKQLADAIVATSRRRGWSMTCRSSWRGTACRTSTRPRCHGAPWAC